MDSMEEPCSAAPLSPMQVGYVFHRFVARALAQHFAGALKLLACLTSSGSARAQDRAGTEAPYKLLHVFTPPHHQPVGQACPRTGHARRAALACSARTAPAVRSPVLRQREHRSTRRGRVYVPGRYLHRLPCMAFSDALWDHAQVQLNRGNVWNAAGEERPNFAALKSNPTSASDFFWSMDAAPKSSKSSLCSVLPLGRSRSCSSTAPQPGCPPRAHPRPR